MLFNNNDKLFNYVVNKTVVLIFINGLYSRYSQKFRLNNVNIEERKNLMYKYCQIFYNSIVINKNHESFQAKIK